MEVIQSLGTGKALVSFLGEDGTPDVVEKAAVLPPQSSFQALDEATRQQTILSSIYYTKYANAYDPDSAYEFLMRKGMEEEARIVEERLAAEKEKEREALDKEKRMQKAAIELKKRFGKNAVLKGMNLEEGATTIERNSSVGGHKAGT